jgi:DNA-binding CsgD family transcriptional regulator
VAITFALSVWLAHQGKPHTSARARGCGVGQNPRVGTGLDSGLLGRELELRQLTRCVTQLDGGGRAATVRGVAGIGKTALWQQVLDGARDAGVTVLATRCAEAEMPLALCGLGDLLDPVACDVLEQLAPAQRSALETALGLGLIDGAATDSVMLPRAVRGALGALCDPGPVIVAIDDAQWLDPATARLLAFAFRRLSERPLGVLVTLRDGDHARDSLGLDACYGARHEAIVLGPLSAGALSALLRSRLEVHVSRPALKRIHDASGGNPMYALELLRATARTDDLGSLMRIALPSSVEELVSDRIGRLPARTIGFLEVVAALERPSVALLRAVVDGADAAMEEAVGERVLVVDDGGRVRFTHPLVGSAVYARVGPARRRSLHARLAGAVRDPEERAGHLARAADRPDPHIAAVLMEAAAPAAARGAPDAAASFAAHARRLTPSGDTGASAARMLAQAGYHADAGEFDRARALADELLGGDLEGPARARALHLRYVLSPPPGFSEGTALLEAALVHTGDDDQLRVRLLSWLASALGSAGDYVLAEQRAREAVALAEALGELELTALTVDALFDICRVRGAAPPPHFQGLLGAARSQQLKGEPGPLVLLGRERCNAGELDTARRLLEAELAASETRGEELIRALILRELAEVELRAGNWSHAARYLDEAAYIDAEDPFGLAEDRSAQAQLAAYQGDLATARTLAHDAIATGRQWGWPELVVRNRWILGFAEMSVGEPRRALEHLEGLDETLTSMGIGNPGYLPLLPDMIETLAVLDRRGPATDVLALLEGQARAREHRWGIPAAQRARAVLELAGGDPRAAMSLAEQAAAGFQAAGFPFDRARSILSAGEALRRLGQRRRAAERLTEAGAIFERLGAPLWQQRTERELRRAAPRPSTGQDLTAAERQVAALVIGGRTNREVAAELFTTVSTVEAHLTRIYRKLGVRSRTELAQRAPELEPEP